MIEYKRIFILGAGFSKAFSIRMPQIADLTEELLSIDPKKNDNLYVDLRGFADQFPSFKQKGEERIKTIENIATVIFSKKIFTDFYEREYYNRLHYQMLRFVYEKTHKYNVDEDKIDVLSRFLKYCQEEHSKGITEFKINLIITFNYDLLIERCIREKLYREIHIDYGLPLQKYSTLKIKPSPFHTRPLQYLKLHGSFNWFLAKGADDCNIDSIYQLDEKDEYDEEDENLFIHEEDVPVFIPMAHAKESFLCGTLYNTLWTKISKYIDKSEGIIFIGYGFPETDVNNLCFFYDYKEKIREIVVWYENDNDPNLKRLRSIFGNEKVLNFDGAEYILNGLKNGFPLKTSRE